MELLVISCIALRILMGNMSGLIGIITRQSLCKLAVEEVVTGRIQIGDISIGTIEIDTVQGMEENVVQIIHMIIMYHGKFASIIV